MNLDTRIFYVIKGFARNTPWLQPVVAGYANNGILVFAALMIAGWWVARKSSGPAAMAAALWTPLGVLAALVVYDPIALAVNETRPCNALHDIVVLHCNTDGGFPSVHTVIAAAVAAGMWLVNRYLGIITVLAAAFMAFARVYVGAHYPGDVLAGLTLGFAISLAGYALARPLLRRLIGHARRTWLRVLLTAQAAESGTTDPNPPRAHW